MGSAARTESAMLLQGEPPGATLHLWGRTGPCQLAGVERVLLLACCSRTMTIRLAQGMAQSTAQASIPAVTPGTHVCSKAHRNACTGPAASCSCTAEHAGTFLTPPNGITIAKRTAILAAAGQPGVGERTGSAAECANQRELPRRGMSGAGSGTRRIQTQRLSIEQDHRALSRARFGWRGKQGKARQLHVGTFGQRSPGATSYW